MPITPFLNGHKFDPETTRVMGVAYEMSRAAFHLRQIKVADEVIANKIIDHAHCPVLAVIKISSIDDRFTP